MAVYGRLTFTGADGTNVTALTPDAGSTVIAGGTPGTKSVVTVAANRVYPQTLADWGICYARQQVPLTTGQRTVQFVHRFLSLTNQYLIVEAWSQDFASGYGVSIRHNSGTTTFDLIRYNADTTTDYWNGSSWTNTATFPVYGGVNAWSPSTGTDYTWALVIDGTSLTVTRDGSTVIGPVTITAFTDWNNTGFWWDQVSTSATGNHLDSIETWGPDASQAGPGLVAGDTDYTFVGEATAGTYTVTSTAKASGEGRSIATDQKGGVSTARASGEGGSIATHTASIPGPTSTARVSSLVLEVLAADTSDGTTSAVASGEGSARALIPLSTARVSALLLEVLSADTSDGTTSAAASGSGAATASDRKDAVSAAIVSGEGASTTSATKHAQTAIVASGEGAASASARKDAASTAVASGSGDATATAATTSSVDVTPAASSVIVTGIAPTWSSAAATSAQGGVLLRRRPARVVTVPAGALVVRGLAPVWSSPRPTYRALVATVVQPTSGRVVVTGIAPTVGARREVSVVPTAVPRRGVVVTPAPARIVAPTRVEVAPLAVIEPIAPPSDSLDDAPVASPVARPALRVTVTPAAARVTWNSYPPSVRAIRTTHALPWTVDDDEDDIEALLLSLLL